MVYLLQNEFNRPVKRDLRVAHRILLNHFRQDVNPGSDLLAPQLFLAFADKLSTSSASNGGVPAQLHEHMFALLLHSWVVLTHAS